MAVSRAPEAAVGPDYREALVATHRPVTLDPLVERDDPASRDIGRLLYRRLVYVDGRDLPTGDLATTWGVSGDGLAYRFTLRPGLHWSNGWGLDANDVVATIAAVQMAGFPDAHLAAAWRGVTATLQGPGVVTLTIPGPRAAFLTTAADLPILPARTLHGRTAVDILDSASRPMPTSGPYRVVSADASSVRLDTNPWSPAPAQLRTMTLRLEPTDDAAIHDFTTGQVDAVLAVSPAERAAVARVSGAHLYDMLTFRFVDLLLNARRPGLDDAAVRHALGAAVDRRALIRIALSGDATAQVDAIPAAIDWVGDRPTEQPDPQLSARALDAAGWHVTSGGPRTRNGVPLAFTLSVPEAAPLPAVARELVRQLGGVGVGVTIRTVPADHFADDVLMPGNFDIALADWDNGPDPDVSTYWRSNATPPEGANVTGVPPDPFLDQALDALATETDFALRRQAAQRVAQRLADDAPAVFLYAPQVTLAVSDALDGIRLPVAGSPADRYVDITAWRRTGG